MHGHEKQSWAGWHFLHQCSSGIAMIWRTPWNHTPTILMNLVETTSLSVLPPVRWWGGEQRWGREEAAEKQGEGWKAHPSALQSRTTHWPPSSVTSLPSHIESLEHLKLLQHFYVLNSIWILRTTTWEWRKEGLPPLFSVSGNFESRRVVYTACQRWDAQRYAPLAPCDGRDIFRTPDTFLRDVHSQTVGS